MRAIALIAVLALPLAACGEAPDDSVYTESAVIQSNTKTLLASSASDQPTLLEKYNLTQEEFDAMSSEERKEMFRSKDMAAVLTDAGFGGKVTPLLSND